jgi:hypothetical protein
MHFDGHHSIQKILVSAWMSIVENGLTTWKLKCRNFNLGLATKARACKVAGQEGSPGMKESAREWTLTLPKELPFWKLESDELPNVYKAITRVKT